MTESFLGPSATGAVRSSSARRRNGLSMADILLLPDDQKQMVNWLLRQQDVTLAQAIAHFDQPEAELLATLQALIEQGFVEEVEINHHPHYHIRLATKAGRQMPTDIWKVLERDSATANVFISYSRRNKAFVQQLYNGLHRRGREVWVDWENIPSAADWWQEIQVGIELADVFVFVLSPASVQSQVCGQEIDHAVKNNKRIIPLVYEEVDPSKVHPELARLNWIFLRESDDFDTGLATLVKTLDTDLAFVRMHTRLLMRATEWVSKDRDESFLLRGSDLSDAEAWLAEGAHKIPHPTGLHQEYLAASRQFETLRTEVELQRQKAILRRQQVLLGIVTVVSIAATIQGVFNLSLYRRANASLREVEESRVLAERQEVSALSLASNALFNSDRPFEALIEAIRAGEHFETAQWAENAPEIRAQVLTALQQSVFWIRERNQLLGHNGIVWDVSLSPDGETIASASSDHTIRLWDIHGQPLHTLVGHEEAVLGVSFSPDGETIASASQDQTVKLWNREGALQTTLTGHRAAVNQVSFSPDGQLIASASDDGTVRLWQPNGRWIRTLEHNAAVRDVQFSPDGQLIATASDDGTVRLWSREGQALETLTGHTGKVYSVSFSPNGQTIASASWDTTVRLWSRDGTPLLTLPAHEDLVHSISFSPDGQTFVTASADKTMKLWRLDGSLISTFVGHTSQVRSAIFSPNGEQLVSAGGDRSVRIWQLNRPFLQVLQDHRASVNSVEFSPDNQMLASAGADNTIKLWRRDGTLLRTLSAHESGIWDLSFSPDSRTLASAGSDWTVKLWDVTTGQLRRSLSGHGAPVYAVAFSHDGQWLVSASEDRSVRLWRSDGTFVRRIDAHDNGVLSVRFSPDSTLIASSSWDNTAKLWSLDGRLLQTFEGHSGWVYDLSFSPDGQTLATASYDNTVKLWDVKTGRELVTLYGHTDGVVAAYFLPDGETLATASADHTLKLWRTDGTLMTTLPGHTGPINDISFSADGQLLASASDDKTVILWNLSVLGHLDQLLDRGCDWLGDYISMHSIPEHEEEAEHSGSALDPAAEDICDSRSPSETSSAPSPPAPVQ